MRRMPSIAVGLAVVALLVACGRSGESQQKEQQEAPAAAQPVAPTSAEPMPTPPPAPAQQPAAPAPSKPKAEPAAPAPAAESAKPAAETTPAAPPVKVKKAGLGVIFQGNLPQGTFRVKVDKDVIYELAFSGKETRAEKEFYVEPGQHVVRFAVIDDKGVRGVKDETMNFVSGKHQTVRVTVKDTPGAIIVEHLE